MAVQDLKPAAFPTLQWEAGQLAGPLGKLCTYAASQTEKNIDWYFRKRQTRRYFCRICRVGVILLTAFAGLLPLINEIIGGKEHALNSLWSAVALAVAATLILLDRFYGFTSGWIRFLLTAQQLTQALEVFRFEVERQKLSWGQLEPTPEQAAMLLRKIQQFHEQVLGIINDETKTWAAEFTEVLKQLDEQAKLATQAKQKAALQLTVTNGDQCSDGWMLTVGERAPEKRTGKEASVEVLPGLHIVRINGQIADRPVQAETAVKVGPGDIQKVEITLV
jgi:hypothetical protein